MFPPLHRWNSGYSASCFYIGVMSAYTGQWNELVTYSWSDTPFTMPYFFLNCCAYNPTSDSPGVP